MGQLHDSALRPVIQARDDSARDDAIAEVIAQRARPVIDTVLAPYRRSGFALSPHDADDIAASVALRLLRKLRSLGESPHDAIERFDSYVATLTFNEVHDFFRRRSPNRARLKNRLRYVVTHDRRLALWGSVAGLAEWSGRRDTAAAEAIERHSATLAMLDAEHPADAVAAIFARIGAPLPFDGLVRIVAELWSVVDLAVAPPAVRSTPATQLDSVESKETLRQVWSEIQELPVRQRCALLLNLRDGDKGNAVALLVLSGVVTLAEIARALEMPAAALAGLWSHLPLDDLAIAARLGVTRQQVINLRKSARARLARRVGAAK